MSPSIPVNKQVKDKTLAKRTKVQLAHIKHSKLPEAGEGERPEDKVNQREGHLGSAEAPACSIQRSMLCEDQREGA